MDEKQLVQAFRASIANHEKCSSGEEKKRGIRYKIKYIIWYLLLTFFSPHRNVGGCVFAACMTPVNENRIKKFGNLTDLYRFAKLNASFDAVCKNISVLSGYSLVKRINILCSAIAFYKRNKKTLKGYLHFSLEYYAIAYFLNDRKFRRYLTPGMYDRYCTLFSYLGRINGATLIGVQDGAAVSIDVPAKVYCDVMNCFDEFESRILRKFIRNQDCKFVYTGFTSVLTWSEYKRTGKKVMAIASQDWFTGKTLELVSSIMDSDIPEKWDVILLPHYRESREIYKDIREKYANLIIEHDKRYKNIDLLVTFYSTIVYDFWSVNKDLKVLCLKIPGYEPGYYERPNVSVYEDMSELIKGIL